MKSLSFSDRLKAGWSKADLMRHYSLNEAQYQKVVESLQGISMKRN